MEDRMMNEDSNFGLLGKTVTSFNMFSGAVNFNSL